MTWYELDKERLVVEFIKTTTTYPEFKLFRRETAILWCGSITVVVGGVTSEPLSVQIIYPDSFPIRPPLVEVISPSLDPSEVGHDWHRWVEGNVCYVHPKDWEIRTTTDEIIDKLSVWYFNYRAVKQGLISKMPDFGKAEIIRE